MSTSNQPDASAASGSDTRSDASITDLVRAFYEPFRTGDTMIYGEILMGHEPTGRRIEMRTIDIPQVQDNRIVITWHLEDFAGLTAQLTAPTEDPVRGAWS
jgi:hypothetical protein